MNDEKEYRRTSTNSYNYTAPYMRNYSMDGSAVRKVKAEDFDYNYEVQEEEVQVPERKTVPIRKTHRRSRLNVNLINTVLIIGAAVVMFYVCIEFLKIQGEITMLNKNIANIQNELASLEKENDAFEANINESFDIQEIYNYAIGELGMVFPNNNEIIFFENSEEGYVRQYKDIE